jgi:amino acid adenylation domain-containing protein
MTGTPGVGAAAARLSLGERSNLTSAQFLMWLGQQLDADSPLYTQIVTVTIEGPLQPAAFAQAFDRLIAQSDALRTVIEIDSEGVPQARLRAPWTGALEIVGGSAHDHAEPAAAAWVAARRSRRFALDEQLFDAALLRLGDRRHLWYLAQHHLITDGGALAVLYDRLAELYRRTLDGTVDEAAPLPLYADWVVAERAARGSAAAVRAQEYWSQKLATPVEPLALFGQTSPPGTASERVRIDLGEARTAALHALAATPAFRTISRDLSLYALLATAVALWLHALSGRDRFRIGMPCHNRTSPAFRRTIGLFLEMSPLDVEVRPDDTCRTLFGRIVTEIQSALRHTQPGSTTASANRAYEVLLNFVTATLPPFCGMPTQVDWVHAGHSDRAHAVRFQVEDFTGSGRLGLHVDFNCSVFSPQRRRDALDQVVRVVDRLLAWPEAPVRQIEIISPDDRVRCVEAFNDTRPATPPPASVVTLIHAQARRTPHAVAIGEGQRTLTYARLMDRVRRLALHLRTHGVGAGVFVPICTERSIEAVVGILGVLDAGGAYVPLDPAFPEARLAFILDDLAAATPDAPRLVVTTDRLAARLPAHAGHVVRLDEGEAWWTEPVPPVDVPAPARNDLAYCLYTSGSTGQPKGVLIEHGALANYVTWAVDTYTDGRPWRAPLFSALTFDLTVTSIFAPLVSGGTIVVYGEDPHEQGLVVRRVLDEDAVDVVKLTPAHLALLVDRDCSRSGVRVLIVGGEDLKTSLAAAAHAAFGGRVAIYNEYGPTEATVGCMVHRFDPAADQFASVPIGRPARNARIYVLDALGRPVPPGVTGEIAIGGAGVARGYLHREALTAERFVADTFVDGGGLLYLTGDRARWRAAGEIEFLGRADRQVKVGGVRMELEEIEAALAAHPDVRACVVDVVAAARPASPVAVVSCRRCGLPSNYPGVTLDGERICSVCRGFESYRDKADVYFRTMDDLRGIVERMQRLRAGAHDCVVLLSGGKDSTYMLYRLVDLGVRPLAFTLDNGFISPQAKANIRRVAAALGIDHVFGSTPAMNQIFVDSLHRYDNVCQGCFKTIYTLAVALARERGIRFIVTGLSRGQFFETRLTEDLFRMDGVTAADIDALVLEARKAYHRRDDVVARSLDVDVFRGDEVFDDVEFVDFYRYCDVGLQEMYAYLDARAPWVRPSDTGRSTNCLINDVGIFVHKAKRGYHNYALPYSWDVRLGHKTLDEATEELNDAIDVGRVQEVLRAIDYDEDVASPGRQQLVAWVVTSRPVETASLRESVAAVLPRYMVPSRFVTLDRLPLTPRGKVDRSALPIPSAGSRTGSRPYEAPTTPLEAQLAALWAAALGLDRVGVHDNFFELGGDSIVNIQLVASAQRAGLHVSPQELFRSQTVAELARSIEAGGDNDATGNAARTTPRADVRVSEQDIADVLAEFGEA